MSHANRERLIQQYLTGQMTADTEQEFELRLLEDPDLLAEVKLGSALQEGLLDLQQSGQLAELLEKETRGGWRAWIAGPFQVAAVAAASLVVGVFLGSVELTDSPETLVVPSKVIEVEALRSTGTDRQVVNLNGVGSALFRAYVGEQYQMVNLELRGPDSTENIDSMPVDSLGFVVFSIPADSLQTASYDLQIADSDGTVLFAFKLSIVR